MYYQQYKDENNLPKALGISTLVMGILLLIGFFVVFAQTIPEYGMGGLVVNYGTSAEGMGDDFMNVDEPSVDENANQVRPDKIEPNSTPVPTPSQQVAERNVTTQDVEDAPAVKSTSKPVATNVDQSTKEKVNATPSVNPNALFKGKKNNGTGGGDGTTGTPGNQGSNLGDPLASNYGEGGSGFGNMMLSLANRRWEVPPNVPKDGTLAGVIVIEFTVDNRTGRIVNARSGKGTKMPDQQLINKCISSVMNARLNPNPNATDTQVGQVTFNYTNR